MDLHAIKDRLEGGWDELDDKISDDERNRTWLIGLPVLVALAVVIWVVRRFIGSQPSEPMHPASRHPATAASLPRREIPLASPAPQMRSQAVAQAVAPVETKASISAEPTVKPSDLTVIEGIGPKIAGVLRAAGINTFSDLANTSSMRLTEVLSEAGIPLGIANPGTWPEQSRLAAGERWEELKELQLSLRAGRRKAKPE